MRALQYVVFAIFAVCVAGFFIFFLMQNDQRVQLCFYKYCTKEGLLSGYILASLFIGMVVASVLFIFPLLKFKASKMSLQKQIKKYEKEIHGLRNQPLEDLPQNPNVEVAKLVDKEDTVPPHLLQSP